MSYSFNGYSYNCEVVREEDHEYLSHRLTNDFTGQEQFIDFSPRHEMTFPDFISYVDSGFPTRYDVYNQRHWRGPILSADLAAYRRRVHDEVAEALAATVVFY